MLKQLHEIGSWSSEILGGRKKIQKRVKGVFGQLPLHVHMHEGSAGLYTPHNTPALSTINSCSYRFMVEKKIVKPFTLIIVY